MVDALVADNGAKPSSIRQSQTFSTIASCGEETRTRDDQLVRSEIAGDLAGLPNVLDLIEVLGFELLDERGALTDVQGGSSPDPVEQPVECRRKPANHHQPAERKHAGVDARFAALFSHP